MVSRLTGYRNGRIDRDDLIRQRTIAEFRQELPIPFLMDFLRGVVILLDVDP